MSFDLASLESSTEMLAAAARRRCERARAVSRDASALAAQAHDESQRTRARAQRTHARLQREKSRAQRKRLIWLKWETRELLYGQLRPAAAWSPDDSQFGVPIEFPQADPSEALWASDHQRALFDEAASKAIHRLFAIGLGATSALTITTEPAVRERLQHLVNESDLAIKELRLAIFEMNASNHNRSAV